MLPSHSDAAPASRRLLTPEEAQAALGVSPRTLLRYVDRGWLPAQRTPGGHRRYLETDVEQLRDGGAPSAASSEPAAPAS